MLAFVFAIAHLFTLATNAPQEVPSIFSEQSGRILLPVEINGKRLWFHLDSGANGIFIDAGAAHRAGLVTEDGHRTLPADITIGPVTGKGAWMSLLPQYGYMDGDVHVDGLIGTPFLRSNIVRLDYGSKRVVVIPRAAFDPAAVPVKPTTVDYNNGAVRVPVWFGNLRANLLFDTGAQRTFLFDPFARSVEIGAPLTATTDVRIGYGAEFSHARQIRTMPMDVGGTRIESPVLYEALEQSTLPPALFDGILGRDVYAAFKLTIDYDDSVMYFEPK